MPRALTNLPVNDWAQAHEMPVFASKSFHQLWQEGKVKKG